MPKKPKQEPAYLFVEKGGRYAPHRRGGKLFTFDAKTWAYKPFQILGIMRRKK